MTTTSGTSMIQTRIADSTRDEQEKREIQQRQLPVMASIRRRERELHRIRLETNARLEKIQLRVAEETNARRVLLIGKFKKSGLEKVSNAVFACRLLEVLVVGTDSKWIVSKDFHLTRAQFLLNVVPTDTDRRRFCSEFGQERHNSTRG